MLAISLRLASMFMLAATYICGKILAERHVGIGEIVFYRQLFAFPVVTAWLMLTMGARAIPTTRLRMHGSRTVLGMIGMLLNFGAVALLPLAESTSIAFTMPIFATIFSALVLHEKIGVHRWSAVLLGFIGIVIMAHPDSHNLASFGVLVALAGAVVTAVISIVLRDLNRTEQPPTIVFWFTTLSLPPLALLALFTGKAHDPAIWGLLVLLGITGGAAQLLMTSALRWAPVSIVIPMDYSQLIWATWAGWLFWGAWPTLASWSGAVLIAASGLYIAWREHIRRSGAQSVSLEEDRAGRSG
ncbi:MAG: DMT family transporter [Sphingobium sp.]|nr:DMT family transporter [Sphingobium sp.]